MNCEIISVGTELLLGDILNTNTQYLAQELAAMGIPVLFQSTVGDNASRLDEMLELALSRSDVIITTGGLGPTPDDLTKEVCCAKAGATLTMHKESFEKIEAFFQSLGREMTESNKKQAMLPEGGLIFQNPYGTAPGCGVEFGGKVILMLPGPPREMRPMFEAYVKPYLLKFSGGTIVSHSLHVFGMGESTMSAAVRDLEDGVNPTVAPYAKDGEALLRVTAMAKTERECEALCRPVMEEIRRRLGSKIYGVDCGNLQTRVVELLKKQKKQVSTAESCTAGLIAKRLTEVPGSSDVFECGIVSYSNEVKQRILGVKEESLKQFGAVSEQVAAEMAQGAYRVGKADFGIGVTGIAGPGGGSQEKPVGLSFVALYDGTKTVVKKVLTGRGGDNREYNRTVAASNALDLLRRALEELDTGSESCDK